MIKENVWYYSTRLTVVSDTIVKNHIGQIQMIFNMNAQKVTQYALRIKECVIREMIMNLFTKAQIMISELYVNLIRSKKIRPTVNEVLFTLSLLRYIVVTMNIVAISDIDGYENFQKFISDACEKIDEVGNELADWRK